MLLSPSGKGAWLSTRLMRVRLPSGALGNFVLRKGMNKKEGIRLDEDTVLKTAGV